MRLVQTVSVALAATALLVACSDPVAPVVDGPRFARSRPVLRPPSTIPDSIGIPPMPPPFFEEVPPDAL
ncbi:MAG: hypothetical protein ACT4PJ_11190 [Gemmatimonadaceae bacterium]